MKSSNQVTSITPTLAKDVSFSDKVEVVDTALKSRAAIQREIKTKWVGIVKVLTKYEVKAPVRRVDAGAAANLVNDLVVYTKKPETPPKFKQILDAGHGNEVSKLATRPNLWSLIDAKVDGFRKFVEDFAEARAVASEALVKDEAATKAARVELQKAVDNYLDALESFEDTVT